jgi:UDP-N-acetylmuramate dehydrogenase
LTSIIREHCTLTRSVPLEHRNTLGVAAEAAWLAQVRRQDALPALLATPDIRGLPVLVLGAGSNVLFAADFPGVVVTLELPGIEVLGSTDEAVRLAVGAGVVWDALVDWTLARGLVGFENLALIPGLAGAAPIQNIGAYGVEIAEFVASVTAWDRRAGEFAVLARDACAFAYRDSRFKHESERWIITGIELTLPRRRELRLDYPGLREELADLGIARPDAHDVATAVRRLRRRKLPDPAAIGNAGSFFKNPVVSRERFAALVSAYPTLPSYPAPTAGERKLSAAWLIEHAGLKGHREGDAGVSAHHALVLVNHGAATGAELLALADRVIATVAERFDVRLEPEPRIIGDPGHL